MLATVDSLVELRIDVLLNPLIERFASLHATGIENLGNLEEARPVEHHAVVNIDSTRLEHDELVIQFAQRCAIGGELVAHPCAVSPKFVRRLAEGVEPEKH